jgi:hypothetical protein
LKIYNPFLNNFLKPADEEIIRNNQRIIRDIYSPERYGHQLYGIYKKLSARA